MNVVTVLGEVGADALGVTLPHEHLLLDLRNQYAEPNDPERRRLGLRPVCPETVETVRRDPYALRDNLLLDDVDCAVAEVERFRDAGGRTIVECTSRGLGPRPADLATISRRTGVHAVAGCGYYTQDTHPSDMAGRSVEQIADEMVRDLTEGIDGSGVRAGLMGELGTSRAILPQEMKVLRAAARAFRQVPRAIHIHTYPWGKEGKTAARVLIDDGVDPGRIVICHIDVTFDPAYLRELLALGVFIEFDDFGKEFEPDAPEGGFAGGRFATDDERVQVVRECIEWGYGSRLLVTNDICLKCMLHAYGGAGYTHILDDVVPLMRAAGIAQADIDRLLVENPRRVLAG
jgi:phosphotriesterase-related protein